MRIWNVLLGVPVRASKCSAAGVTAPTAGTSMRKRPLALVTVVPRRSAAPVSSSTDNPAIGCPSPVTAVPVTARSCPPPPPDEQAVRIPAGEATNQATKRAEKTRFLKDSTLLTR